MLMKNSDSEEEKVVGGNQTNVCEGNDVFESLEARVEHCFDVDFSAKDLLKTAPNPYVHFGKDLSISELYAAIVSTATTVGANYLFNSAGDTAWINSIRAPVLSLVGPTSEKGGLFIPIYQKIRKENSEESRIESLKKTWKKGWPILKADILYHDSFYTTSSMLALYAVGQQPGYVVGGISAACFLGGLVFAAFSEVKSQEWMYKRFQKKLDEAGFHSKEYHEARFIVEQRYEKDNPVAFLERLLNSEFYEGFDFSKMSTRLVNDYYPVLENPSDYNHREAYIRFRDRKEYGGDIISNIKRFYQDPSEFIDETYVAGKNRRSVQIKHNLPKKYTGEDSMYRRYASYVHKASYRFESENLPKCCEEIDKRDVKRLIAKSKPGDDLYKVQFMRFVAQNERDAFVAVDIPIINGKPSSDYIVEVKGYNLSEKFKALYEAIPRDLTIKNVTTRGKYELIS